MGSIFTQQRETIALILSQAHDGILQLKDWTNGVDVLSLPQTPQGAQDLAGDVMLLQAICECVKQINKRAPRMLDYDFDQEVTVHVVRDDSTIGEGKSMEEVHLREEIIATSLNSTIC